MKKKTKIIIITGIMLCFLILVTNGFSYAIYASKSVWNHNLESKEFYFSSDYLKDESLKNVNNYWNGENISFNIKNSSNNELITAYDIKYKVECSTNNPKITCSINDIGSNYSGTLSSEKACVNNIDDVDVSTYDKSTCEINGYTWSDVVAVKDLYFNLSSDEEIGSVIVTIKVTSTEPYKKVLTGTFELRKDKSLNGSVGMNYVEYDGYSRLVVSNSYNKKKCAKITWNSSNLLIDVSFDELKSSATDVDGYVNEIIVSLDSKSNRNFKFYRRGTDSYTVNDFSLIESDC